MYRRTAYLDRVGPRGHWCGVLPDPTPLLRGSMYHRYSRFSVAPTPAGLTLFHCNGNKNERPSFEHNQALNTKQCQLTTCSLTTMHVDLPVDYPCYTCVRLRVRVRVRACACACLQVAIQHAFRNSLLKCFTVEALAGSAAVLSSLNEMIGQAMISESR